MGIRGNTYMLHITTLFEVHPCSAYNFPVHTFPLSLSRLQNSYSPQPISTLPIESLKPLSRLLASHYIPGKPHYGQSSLQTPIQTPISTAITSKKKALYLHGTPQTFCLRRQHRRDAMSKMAFCRRVYTYYTHAAIFTNVFGRD